MFDFRSNVVEDDSVVAPVDEDSDVTQERRRVLRGSGRHDLLQLRNLSKVRGLSDGDFLKVIVGLISEV